MTRLLPLLLLVSLGLLVVGCGGQPQTPTSPAARTTVLIGVDALDWQVLDPAIDAGRAPNFAALRDRGASGINLSFVPMEKSPLIWATMATGLEPEGHGVGGFIKQRGDDRYETLASAADWQAPAIWDIAGAAGLRSTVIGWWVTFPARDIDGVMVSDHVSFTTAGNRNPEGMVRPADLTDELAALSVDWRDVPLDLLRVVLPDAPDAVLADPDQQQLQGVRLAIAGDLTYLATAKHLLARSESDFFAVYFRGFDLVCHDYWSYWRHGEGREPAAEDRALLGRIVPNYLYLVDAWLGELLPLLPDDANIVVVSDHGFHGPRRDRSGSIRKGVAEHRPEGALIIASPLYQPGSRFDRSFVLNVTPTVMALLGLPASQDMPGRVLRDGLTDAALTYVDHLETHRIASYASLAPAPPPEVADDPALDAAVKKKLKSLGYVD